MTSRKREHAPSATRNQYAPSVAGAEQKRRFRYPPRVRRPPKRTLRAMLPTTTDRIHRRSQHSPRLLRVHPRRRRWPLRRLREVMNQARRLALADLKQVAASLGANAVIGVDTDYEVITKRGSMLLVSITGAAVDGRSTNSNRRGPARVESRQRTERYAAREPRRREEDQPEPSPAPSSASCRRTPSAPRFRDATTERRQHPEHTETNISRNAPSVPARNPAEQAASKRPTTGTHRVFRDTDRRRASRAHRPKSRTPANRRRAYRPRKRAPQKKIGHPGTKGQNLASNRARHREARLSVPERLFRARSTRPDGRPDNANAGAAPHPHARRYSRNFNCPSASSWMTSIS